jgi:hypothetical protein
MSVRAVSARGRLRRCWARKQGELSSRSSRPKLILGRHLLFGTLAVVTASCAVIAAPAQAARRLSWLAAGDSYSSGEGLPHATGHCAQARPGSGSEAWPFAAHDGLGKTQPALASPTFTACTRATTAQFFDSKKIKYYLKNVTLPAEWNPSMGRFDLVSFTFGGDDVRFADVIIQCVTKPALRLSCPGDALLRKRIAEFGRGYGAFLRKVANQAVVRGGNILVLGYPELIEKPSLWSARARVLGCGHLTPTDADELRGLAGDLNATLGANVAEVNRQHPKGVHLTFVDVTSGGSAGISPVDPNLFEPATGSRHEVCSSKPWINPLSAIDRKNGSYHPKQAGQNAMGALAAQVSRAVLARHLPGIVRRPPRGRRRNDQRRASHARLMSACTRGDRELRGQRTQAPVHDQRRTIPVRAAVGRTSRMGALGRELQSGRRADRRLARLLPDLNVAATAQRGDGQASCDAREAPDDVGRTQSY